MIPIAGAPRAHGAVPSPIPTLTLTPPPPEHPGQGFAPVTDAYVYLTPLQRRARNLSVLTARVTSPPIVPDNHLYAQAVPRTPPSLWRQAHRLLLRAPGPELLLNACTIGAVAGIWWYCESMRLAGDFPDIHHPWGRQTWYGIALAASAVPLKLADRAWAALDAARCPPWPYAYDATHEQ